MNSLHYDTTHPLTVLTVFTTHLPSDYIPIYYPHIYIYLPTHLTYCLHYPPTYQRTAFTSYLPTTVTYPHICIYTYLPTTVTYPHIYTSYPPQSFARR